MQDNKIKCQYVEALGIDQVDDIEKYFDTLLPNDYTSILPLINRGKPKNHQIDICDRKGCVVDYFVDLSLVIEISNNIQQSKFIAIASDPFGNYFGFLKGNNDVVNTIHFWDHESNDFVNVANSFDSFINNLY